jgi:hypothetical protein
VSERDQDAWWSPIPGAPEPSPGSRPGLPAAPYAAPIASDAPAVRPRRRRWPWVVSGATVLAVVVCAVLALAGGRAGTKTLIDPAGTVAVAVPRSWYDNTGDAGSNPDAPPILAASNLWQSRWMEVDRFDVDDVDDLRTFHTEGVDRECAGWPCTTRSGPRALTVGGHEALEQVVTHPSDANGGASSSLTLTVWLDDEAVELYAVATAGGDTPPDAAPLEAIATSLRLL